MAYDPRNKKDTKSLLSRMLLSPSVGVSNTRSYEESVSRIGEAYNNAKMYKGNQLDDAYTSLVGLLKSADSEEGMKTYNRNLSKFKTDSLTFGGFTDNIIQSDTLKLLGNQKNAMRRDFDTSIQDTSNFINTTQFLDKAEEFVNIQDTIDSKKFDGSVADFLQSELANANRLRDGMVAGFKIQQGEIVGTNFRYNKAETNDKDTFRKLNLYRDRLDLAVKSLAGDGMISSEEAEAILIGDEKHYSDTKNAALRKAEKNYTYNRAKVVQWSGLENTAIQNKLKKEQGNTDFLNIAIDEVAGETSAAKLEELTLYNKAQDWDGLIKALGNEKGEYQELKNIANDNYKNWYGSYFEELKGGMTLEESNAFDLKVAQDELEKDTKEKEKKEEEEQQRLEETKERYKEPKEEKKIQTYNIDEKNDAENLLAGYLSGNISNSAIQNIGGQSLLNRARVMKNAYKGRKPQATIIPGIKTKGITPVDMEYLKTTNFKNPGKSGTFSFEDISSEIHSKGGNITKKVSNYLTGKESYDVTWTWRRKRVQKIRNKFEQLNLSVEEFRAKHPKDYKYLADVLANPGGKPYRWK
jgi:hypothetical protein